MNAPKTWLAENTNPERRETTLGGALEGTDLFIGLSGPGVISVEDVKTMNPDPFVFAMANPVPEVAPRRPRRS